MYFDLPKQKFVMKKKLNVLLVAFLIFTVGGHAQSVSEKLRSAMIKFENEKQLDNALIGLYVVNAQTGEKVYAKNEDIGMATASCLKLVTSATAFDVLGKNYTFNTKIMYLGKIEQGILNGDLVIAGSGDPTLGSWRWETTKTGVVINKIIRAIKQQGIKQITGRVIVVDGYNKNVTPSTWIWEDLGNYYGAPPRLLNWRENQYDIHFATGQKAGEKTRVVEVDPPQPDLEIINEVSTGADNSGDQCYIYLPPLSGYGLANGSLPPKEDNYIVSGAMPNPSKVFIQSLQASLQAAGLSFKTPIMSTITNGLGGAYLIKGNVIDTIQSPSLDKINFWFMRRSINLYGECLINKIAEEEGGEFNTNSGVKAIKNHWKKRGIAPNALNIYDGSGLSPSNRVTPKALVNVLQYAKKQKWFSTYLEAFPNYNDMKLKSGTIGDVKGFSGYHTAKDGTEYIISFLVNNFNGPASGVVAKMFKVLDILK
jgi:D-alanyl-D-alanine carboxypeptidase/D-alanyl-D-alanine-endopeptidase (penicillin-binding protein 4)